MSWIALMVAAGIGAALVGLIGFGSSLVILPVALIVFPTQFDSDVAMRLAIGTTMATMVVGALSAGYAQTLNGQVCWPLLRLLAIPYVLGAGLGPWLGLYLPTRVLSVYIGVLLLVVGVLSVTLRTDSRHARQWSLHRFEIVCVHVIIGLMSSLGGIASGVFAIPYLSRFDLPLRTVIATSTVAAALYSLIATLGYVVVGFGTEGLPSGAIGFVYLPAFLLMSVVGLFCGSLGVRVGHRLSTIWLRRILALFLFIAGTVVLIR